MRIYRLTGLVVVKTDGGLVVQATGLSSSAGWGALELRTDDPNPQDRILELSFDGKPPSGPVIQVLNPVSASTVVSADNVDGILVKSRTNSMEVHASEFQSVGQPITTFRIGEEGPPPTTLRLGEEEPTTLALGEEEPLPSTHLLGEESPTTERLGEEGFTTLRLGEEGPLGTDIRIDDPMIFSQGTGVTTLAVGEEGGGHNPTKFGGTAFGGF